MRGGFWLPEHFLGDILPESGETAYTPYGLSGTGAVDLNASVQSGVNEAGTAEITIPDDTTGLDESAGWAHKFNRGFPANGMFGVAGYVARCRVDNPPAAGQEYQIFTGIGRATGAPAAEPADGIYFFADENSANWIIRHTRAGAPTSQDTGIAVATNTYQDLEFRANIAAGTVDAFIDGVPGGQIVPANIQPSAAICSLSALAGLPASVRGSAVEITFDFIGYGVQYP